MPLNNQMIARGLAPMQQQQMAAQQQQFGPLQIPPRQFAGPRPMGGGGNQMLPQQGGFAPVNRGLQQQQMMQQQQGLMQARNNQAGQRFMGGAQQFGRGLGQRMMGRQMPPNMRDVFGQRDRMQRAQQGQMGNVMLANQGLV